MNQLETDKTQKQRSVILTNFNNPVCSFLCMSLYKINKFIGHFQQYFSYIVYRGGQFY